MNAEPCWCGHSEQAHVSALVCVVCPNPPANHTYEPVTSVRREIARLRAEIERLKSLAGME